MSGELERYGPTRFDVWTWTPGKRWRRALVDIDASATRAALHSETGPGLTVAAFSHVLDIDPRRLDAHELAELADAIDGPIPDTLRRRHTR